MVPSILHLESFRLRCVYQGDISAGQDALALGSYGEADAIITNPPYARPLMHALIAHFQRIAPTWLLLEMDWAATRQAEPFLPSCSDIVVVGRLRLIEGTKHAGKENFGWFRFTANHASGPILHPRVIALSSESFVRPMRRFLSAPTCRLSFLLRHLPTACSPSAAKRDTAVTAARRVRSPMPEYFETGSKKPGRGMAQRSLDLIEAMREIAKPLQPITGRGIGYQLFTRKLIDSMARSEMARVYRLLKEARERGIIPWSWIVDETRSIERVSTWDNPADYARTVAQSYRRDFWNQQPHRVLVMSEKGTVRGVLAPVLDQYAVGFLPVGGFSSATKVHDLAEDDDGRPLHLLYVGDYDPSGLYMSERDIPDRLAKYDGDHAKLRRIALRPEHLSGLTSFPAPTSARIRASSGSTANYGTSCWELDAMDPRDLRDCVEREILKLIEPVAWERCELVNRAEQASLKTILEGWGAPPADA